MINHISIAVNDPKKVADVLAEIWDGSVYPFPPAPGSFFVLANDGKGSAVEIIPAGTVITPGEGMPDENNIDAATEEFEARFVKSDIVPPYVATHVNINTKKSIDEIREIAKREGWRTLIANRGEGLFQLIEVWVENNFMFEVMTPEQTARYVEITSPEFMEKAFAGAFEAHLAVNQPAESLNLIG